MASFGPSVPGRSVCRPRPFSSVSPFPPTAPKTVLTLELHLLLLSRGLPVMTFHVAFPQGTVLGQGP